MKPDRIGNFLINLPGDVRAKTIREVPPALFALVAHGAIERVRFLQMMKSP